LGSATAASTLQLPHAKLANYMQVVRGKRQGQRAETTSVSRMNSLPVRLAKYAAVAIPIPCQPLSLSFTLCVLLCQQFIPYDSNGYNKSLAYKI